MLQATLFRTLKNNMNADFSLLVPDVTTIAGEVDTSESGVSERNGPRSAHPEVAKKGSRPEE
jgi:hypothetical protein